MATLAMSTAGLGVTASGAATPAAGNAQHPSFAPVVRNRDAFGTRFSAFAAKLFDAVIESRKEQAMAAIERHDWRLAAELRAEQRAEAPLN